MRSLLERTAIGRWLAMGLAMGLAANVSAAADEARARTIFSGMEEAKKNETADTQTLCEDIKRAARETVFGPEDVRRLIGEIEFPLTAKNPFYVPGKFQELDLLLPVAQVLALMGSVAADRCLEELAAAKTVGRREWEFYLVMDFVYGTATDDRLRERLGAGSPVLLELREAVARSREIKTEF